MALFHTRERKERPERFGPDFAGVVSAAFRECRPVRRVLIVLLLLLGVFGLAVGAQAFFLLGLIGAPFLLMTRPLPRDDDLPSDEQLAAADAERENEEIEEYVASGKGYDEIERILVFLGDLIDRHVSVTFGNGDPDWRPAMRLEGILQRRHDVIDDDGDEVLKFAVGDTGSGFYLARAAFMRGEAISERAEDGTTLFLLLGNGVVLMICESTPANA